MSSWSAPDSPASGPRSSSSSSIPARTWSSSSRRSRHTGPAAATPECSRRRWITGTDSPSGTSARPRRADWRGWASRNVEEMTAYLSQRGIACDYEPTGRLIAALTEGQLEDARRSVAIARHLGLDGYRLLDREEIRALLDSPLYLGGVQVRGRRDPRSGEAGGRPQRGSGAGRRPGARAEPRRGGCTAPAAGSSFECAGGSVRARRAVLATSAYTHQLLPRVRPGGSSRSTTTSW